MVLAADGLLAYATQNRANIVRNGIAQRVQNSPRWGVDTLVVSEWPGWRFGVVGTVWAVKVSIRFNNRVDQEDLNAWVEANAVGQNLPLDGSYYQWHDCNNDVEHMTCGPSTRREWAGGALGPPRAA